jgi:hypothetical protein
MASSFSIANAGDLLFDQLRHVEALRKALLDLVEHTLLVRHHTVDDRVADVAHALLGQEPADQRQAAQFLDLRAEAAVEHAGQDAGEVELVEALHDVLVLDQVVADDPPIALARSCWRRPTRPCTRKPRKRRGLTAGRSSSRPASWCSNRSGRRSRES